MNKLNLDALECQCGECSGVVPFWKLTRWLECVEQKQEISVHCGARCHNHNREVGGRPNSYHLNGMAADISLASGGISDQLLIDCLSLFDGVIVHDTFIHVDLRCGPSYYSDKRSSK